MMEIKNIFSNLPDKISEEIIENIINNKKIRIERIVSKGHSSPPNYCWYDQDENEWIIILKGSAMMLFYNDISPITLKEGDYLNIGAHIKHRVEWTDPSKETIWLAIFY